MKRKEPTWTSLVLQALTTNKDDFMSVPMLMKHTGGTRSQMDAALWHLRQHHAVDVVIEVDGRGWWFALPKEIDTRIRAVAIRAPEVKPRKPRKAKLHKVA